VNAMAASDAILVPLQCEFFALEGLSQLLQTVDRCARRSIEPVDPRHRADHVRLAHNLSNQVVADVRQFMGSKVYNTMIRVTSVSPRRRPTASRCWSNDLNASAAMRI